MREREKIDVWNDADTLASDAYVMDTDESDGTDVWRDEQIISDMATANATLDPVPDALTTYVAANPETRSLVVLNAADLTEYDIGGVKLMYPGDWTSGASEEIINCRCTMLPAF
jgi:hypothetical protein